MPIRTGGNVNNKADKDNVLELDNITPYTPDEDYEPATKLYVDNSAGAIGGNMTKAVYDPTNIEASAFDVDNHIDGTTNKVFTTLDNTKLDGVEAGAEVNNISDVNATDLTDSGESTLHYHASDRARASHTGTQTASTISDFDTEVSNNATVVSNTAHITADGKSHSDVVLNNTHRTSDGKDHSDVVLNNSYRAVGHIPTSEKAANNGVATLDASGKIPASQLGSSFFNYQGNWNASTNTPALIDGTGTNGDVYIVSVAGTQDLGSGSITFAEQDWVIYNGSIWEKSVNSNSVVSVNTQTGVVVLDTDDISEGTTNKYLSDVQKTDLTDGGESTLHYHNSDRSRANHTGTQTASTISDFDTEVSNNTDVADNTSKAHTPATLGTKTIDETDIGDKKVIAYNSVSGNIEYETVSDIGGMDKATYDPTNIGASPFARANHTGTQTASTISDFDTEVSANTDVADNTSKAHTPYTLGTKVIDETDIADGLVVGYDSASGNLKYVEGGTGSGGSYRVISYTDTGTLSGAQSTVTIDIAEYDATEDMMQFHMAGVLLTEDVDYVLNTGTKEVTKINDGESTWEDGSRWDATVLQNVLTTAPDEVYGAYKFGNYTDYGTLSGAQSDVTIDISEYDPLVDAMQFYMAGVLLTKDVDYTLNTSTKVVTKINNDGSTTWKDGSRWDAQVFQNVKVLFPEEISVILNIKRTISMGGMV